MNAPPDQARRALLLKAFWMPSVQTMDWLQINFAMCLK